MRNAKLRSAPVALLTMLALACAEEEVEVAEIARPVVVRPVEVFDLEERIEATGELRAKDHATIASEVPGRITELLVEEGQRVEEGERLLAIDPEKRNLELLDAQARVTEARASVAEAKRELERVQKLHDQDIASAQALDRSRTELALARSREEAAAARVGVSRRALQDAEVRAPFAGSVAARTVSRGEYVQVGQPLLDVVALDPIEVEFTVAERDSALVREGLEVSVRVAPYPDERFLGRVTVISPTIDTRTRTLRVKAQIANADARLRPGLFARADLGLARREGVLMIPEEAVMLRAAGELVYVVTDDDRVKKVSVETGTRRDRRVEIRSGLAAGQDVVIRGQATLADGTLVSRRTLDGKRESSELNVASEGSDFAADADREGSAVQ